MARNVYVEQSEPSQCETATPAIQESMRELDRVLDGLGGALNCLVNRLEMVLRPVDEPKPSAVKSLDAKSLRSPMDDKISLQIRTVQYMHEQVEVILDRLEV